MTSAGAASIVMLELVCSAIAVALQCGVTGRVRQEPAAVQAIACPGRSGPRPGRPGHQLSAQGVPVDAKWPTLTHSVVPMRIRRTNGW
ncbi:hypothetical protein GCM10010342_03510 [Streptomyces anulatus]|nr:hypothetical protein GCM10010342_03510 [Streptomyces anulatus]